MWVARTMTMAGVSVGVASLALTTFNFRAGDPWFFIGLCGLLMASNLFVGALVRIHSNTYDDGFAHGYREGFDVRKDYPRSSKRATLRSMNRPRPPQEESNEQG